MVTSLNIHVNYSHRQFKNNSMKKTYVNVKKHKMPFPSPERANSS